MLGFHHFGFDMAKSNSAVCVRVLMIGPLPPPVGGIATVLANLVAAFADSAVEPAIDLRVLNNIKTTRVGRSIWQGLSAQLKLVLQLALQCIRWRPQVVHIHTCSWLSFWRNAVDVVLARLLCLPVVLHIHGGQFGRFLNSLPVVPAWLARVVFGLCARIVVLGDGWKQLLDAWTDPSKVIVVPNGVLVQTPIQAPAEAPAQVVSEFPAQRLNQCDPEPSSHKPFSILCLASYETGKGLSDLIRAVARLTRQCSTERPVQLALFGIETESGQRKMLLELADRLGISDRVEVPGPVMGADKERRLRNADCFCLPSYNEGLPMSMLEAMALGLPVVVTCVGAIPEVVEDGQQGLLYAPGDIDTLTLHLQQLIDHPAWARALGRAGRDRLISSYSLDRSVSLLRDLYGELARVSRSKPRTI
ncbi:MAG TPA: glycosyltransferase family 1 protein [Chromatiaceae bacterium]|nr:MAG: hypothetical protein N838_05345 [Thiohalocapsa sp. PB-PSB1]HBG95346.1 glycosyltransferase family 1 protein [Chromatiaceae bacterium]HCS88746.1 glycosyltransferase family 1 protein [Chromatiaceae bacterium]